MIFHAGSIPLFILLFCCCLSPLEAQNWSNDFAAIDQRARKSPKQLHEDLPALTAYLCENTETELEKVRAVYVWITTHIGYDWKAIDSEKRINHFIRDILQRRVALCFGYAQLFQEMCNLAGIRCAIINGYAKGTATTELPINEPNHSWNAVELDGKWYLLDATWGSSTISKQNEFVQISNDDYFLIRPEQFIRTHLPGNPMWQLLPDPISAESFMGSTPPRMPTPVADSLFNFNDSLDRYFALSPARQNLLNYERTYDFYPTSDNAEQLGHALIDYAGLLTDTLEQIPAETEPERILAINRHILQLCSRARQLIEFYPWQEELFVTALINQAVHLYNLPAPADNDTAGSRETILPLLEKALDIIREGRDSYFNRMARQQCEHYIATIKNRTP